MSHLSNGQLGLTLIEMLIAISLSLMVMSSLFRVYVIQQRQLQWQQDHYELQHRAARLTTMMTQEIAIAGVIGCPKLSTDLPLESPGGAILTAQNRLQGEAHTFTVRDMDHHIGALLTQNQLDPAQIIISTLSISVGDTLIVSDCRYVAIVRVARVQYFPHSMQLTLTRALKHQFSAGAEVAKLNVHHFYVAPTKRKRRDGSPLTALYMTDLSARHVELIPGVTGLSCEYIEVINGHLQRLASSEVSNWAAVTAVLMTADIKVGALHKTVQVIARVMS